MGNTWLNKPGGPLYDPLRQAATKAMHPKGPDMPPVPNATPPQEPNGAAELQAQNALQMQQNRRKSLNSTIFAGGTGGYNPGTAGASPSTGGSRTKTG